MAEEAFSRWLVAYTNALTNSDWQACAALFTPGAIFLPTPFDKAIRGGNSISAWLETYWSRFDGLKIHVDPIGSCWAHWRISGSLEALEEPFRFDGVLNVTFDPNGVCNRLVLWTETLSPSESDQLAQRDA